MVFLPGDHTLDMSITVANISSMTMRGESSSYIATVVCNGSVGLSFTSMVDFKIHSLTFTSCGRSFDKHTLSFGKYTLLLESIEYFELVNCTFHDNLGTSLAAYHSSITLAGNNEFTHNYWRFLPNNSFCIGGGGITALDSNLTFIGNTIFVGNHAIGSGVCGGAIYAVDNTSLRFTGTSNFINNSASLGGAIAAVYNTSLSFTGTSNFINNSAKGGGAIFADFNTSLSFTGTSNFIINSADGGGAIAADHNASLSFTGTSNFINNSANELFGGGLFLANHSTFSISSNATVYWESNRAPLGGAIYVYDEYNPFHLTLPIIASYCSTLQFQITCVE